MNLFKLPNIDMEVLEKKLNIDMDIKVRVLTIVEQKVIIVLSTVIDYTYRIKGENEENS